MKFFFVIQLLIFTQAVLADCQVKSQGKKFKIPESKGATLFSEGKSLSNHAIQDQGELGYCYSNATSVVLKSILPGNPDVSYVHSALQASTLGPGKNWAVGNSYVSKSNDSQGDVSFVNGGNVCDTIEALKKGGGACSKGSSILENKSEISPHLQNKIFMNLGKYFDKFKDVVKSTNPESLKGEMSLIIEEIKVQRAELIDQCREDKREVPFERALRVILEQELVNLSWDDECDKERRERLRKIISPASKLSKDFTIVFLKPETAEKLVSALSANSFLHLQLRAYAKEKNPSPELRDLMANKVAPELIKLFEDLLPNSTGTCPEKKKGFKIDPDIMAKILLFQMAQTTQTPCEELIKTNEVITSLKDDSQCSKELNINLVLDAISPLLDVAGKVEVRKLLNPNTSYGDQIKQILTPGCNEKENLISVNDVTCETRNTCNSNTGTCGNLKGLKEEVKTTVFEGVREGRATGMIFCTGVLVDPNVRSGFCKNPVTGIEGHGNHVVAVSGYRCEKGQIEYEVTNSWGKTCPVKDKSFANSAVKCVLDAKGQPTGRFFITEDALVSNLLDFNIVKNPRKK